MKSSFHPFGLLLLGGGLFCALPFAWAGAIPEGYAVERYSALWEHSPFSLATVQPQAQPSFAQNLALVGIARIEGEDMVTLLNRVSQERFTVGTEPNADGIAVVSVDTDSDPLKTRVSIRKGSEVATVSFDKGLLALTQSPPPPPAGVPAQPAAPNNTQPPETVQVAPVRRVRRTIPIPGIIPAPPAVPAPPNSAPAQ